MLDRPGFLEYAITMLLIINLTYWGVFAYVRPVLRRPVRRVRPVHARGFVEIAPVAPTEGPYVPDASQDAPVAPVQGWAVPDETEASWVAPVAEPDVPDNLDPAGFYFIDDDDDDDSGLP